MTSLRSILVRLQRSLSAYSLCGSFFVLVLRLGCGYGQALNHADSQPGSARLAAPAISLQNPDAACSGCHSAIYAAYRKTSKARGSGVATDGLIAGSFNHRPSGVTYTVAMKNATAQMAYHREASHGRAELAGEVPLSYFIGSGKHGRTYLFSQPLESGQLWSEGPINWYARRAGYDMAPSFETSTSMPGFLPVDPGCLHCHTSGVQKNLPAARNAFAGPPFQQAGVGCSACHGDGSAHIASGGKVAVVSGTSLDPARRDSLCLQCHLEGDAVVYRTGKTLADFRAGDDIASTAVYFVNRASDRTMRRASSQYEALLRSACRRAEGTRLTCTTCHDPHSTPAPEERVAYFRSKCLACHNTPAIAQQHFPDQPDCATCHMPTRKTSDISHEQLTDHDIERKPTSTTTPLHLSSLDGAEASTVTPSTLIAQATVDLVTVGDTPAGDRERGLAYAQFAARGSRDAFERALTFLHQAEATGTADARVHQQLGYLEQLRGQQAAAELEYEQALKLDPNDAASATNLAVLDAAKGDGRRAVSLLQGVALRDPSQTSALLDLAVIECESGNKLEARRWTERALVFNPDSTDAQQFLSAGKYAGTHCDLR